jgi:1-pyrroline-5-carboxylate dehydrogenase
VFNSLWKSAAENLSIYKSYPRIVGETGGKDFVFVLPDADLDAVVAGVIRGAFEYQGQKCSAASRLYLPRSRADEALDKLAAQAKALKTGSPLDYGNFVNAVIDEAAFDTISGYIERAKAEPGSSVLAGGGYDKSKGLFIEPTVILCQNPLAESMVREIFGPVLSVYVYDDADMDAAYTLVDSSSPYALTGAVFGRDRNGLRKAVGALRNAAGNFYINDKPTGAVVGRQPFGGSRASGTNDKAGSMLNLLRWVSPRTIKENYAPPADWRYPYMG